MRNIFHYISIILMGLVDLCKHYFGFILAELGDIQALILTLNPIKNREKKQIDTSLKKKNGSPIDTGKGSIIR